MRTSRRLRVLVPRWCHACRFILPLFMIAAGGSVEPLAAQTPLRQRQVYPRDSYYFAFRDFYDGDLQNALRQFKSEGRRD